MGPGFRGEDNGQFAHPIRGLDFYTRFRGNDKKSADLSRFTAIRLSPRYWRDEPHIIFFDVVDPIADRSDGHRAGIGDQQPLCRRVGAGEPALLIGRRNDHRHPLVHLTDQFVRPRRDDSERLDRLASLGSPFFP